VTGMPEGGAEIEPATGTGIPIFTTGKQVRVSFLPGRLLPDSWTGSGLVGPPWSGGSVMLVLSRKSRESVVVGGADGFDRLLKVTVLAIHGGKVSLGFEVAAGVPVHREEVWERIRAGHPPVGPPAPDGAGFVKRPARRTPDGQPPNGHSSKDN
jgi:carbon storage regulator